MKIFDPSVSKMAVTELRNFIKEAVAKANGLAIKEGEAKLNANYSPNGTLSVSSTLVPTKKEYVERGGIMVPVNVDDNGEEKPDNHNVCSIGALYSFSKLVEPYAAGTPLTSLLTDTNNPIIAEIGLDNVINIAGDAFLSVAGTGDHSVKATALSEDAQSAAFVTAWEDLKIISNVFSANAKEYCGGYKRGAETVATRISNELQRRVAANSENVSGKAFKSDKDYIPH